MDKNRIISIIVFAVLMSDAAVCSSAVEIDERRNLLDRMAKAEAKIAILRQEQDFLIFQKVVSEADSKYLLLDLSAGKGILKYKNRILRTFNLVKTGKKNHEPSSGALVLSNKIDGAPRKRLLLFGKEGIILHAKGIGKMQSGFEKIPSYATSTKDLAAIYFALEKGAMAYVVR